MSERTTTRKAKAPKGVSGRVAGAAKAVTKKVKGLRNRARDAVSDRVLGLVGLLTLGSVLLGALVLYWASRGPLLR